MSRFTSEYEDAVQRARRLSASREKILTGRGNPVRMLTQDDVVIYLRWLVCHLHSVKNIHHFLTVNGSYFKCDIRHLAITAFLSYFSLTKSFNRCCTIFQLVKGKAKIQQSQIRLYIRLSMLTVIENKKHTVSR